MSPVALELAIFQAQSARKLVARIEQAANEPPVQVEDERAIRVEASKAGHTLDRLVQQLTDRREWPGAPRGRG